MRGTRSPIQPSPVLTVRGPLHTQPCGGTLSKQERAGAPHPARATPGPPSPEGKAAYRRGIRRERGRLPCVKGAVSRRLTEGSPCCRLGTTPHPSGPTALPPSPRRGYVMGHWPVLPAGSRPGWRRPLRWRRFSEAPLPVLPWTGPCPPGSWSLRRPRRRWP